MLREAVRRIYLPHKGIGMTEVGTAIFPPMRPSLADSISERSHTSQAYLHTKNALIKPLIGMRVEAQLLNDMAYIAEKVSQCELT